MKKTISIPKYNILTKEKELDHAIVSDRIVSDSSSGLIVRRQDPIFDEYNHRLLESSISPDIAARDMVTISISREFAINTGGITNGFNEQTSKYINSVQNEQDILRKETQDFLNRQAESGVEQTATNLRNKNNWMNVKRLVIREELMKLQIGDKTDLPLSDTDLEKLKSIISDKDLSNMSDKELQQLIDGILKPDQRVILQALKDYKEKGIESPYFQKEKLQALQKELQDIDLNKITAKQLKHIIDNYWEKLEVHHRTSISHDATKQSDINNLDTLKTTDHDKKHTHSNDLGENKVDYKKPVSEESRDRKGELEKLNKKRVVRNEIKGLGITLLIAGGVGFSIGFVVQLAQSGLNPESMKRSFAAGVESGGDAMIISGGSYVISRTIGMKVNEKVFEAIIEKFGDYIPGSSLTNVASAVSLGVSGSIAIMVSLVYQFAKLKIKGFSTKESLIRVGKSARLSFSILFLSVAAQGIWGGHAGLIVSITAGVIITGSQIAMMTHEKNIRSEIYHYYIELSEPQNLSYLMA